MLKDDPKVIKSWVFYDWANSVYPLVISSAIFPIFYAEQTSTKNLSGEVIADTVNFMGYAFKNTELISYVLSLSYLLVAFFSPLLSGIADYTGNKLFFLKTFCYIGVVSALGMFFFDVNHLELSMVAVLMASVGYWGSIVFYNSYLPDICSPKNYDIVSARGFSMGYIGSVILLVANLVMIMVFNIPVKWCFVSVAAWWFIFGQISYRNLPRKTVPKQEGASKFKKGFLELYNVWKEIQLNKPLRRYLAAYFVYSMGVQTVLIMAAYFGEKEIIWSTPGQKRIGLIASILAIQVIGILGAYLHSYVSEKIGNKRTIIASLSVWVGLCIYAFFINQPKHFFVIAGIVGLVMGGIQALSRSSFSKLMPETDDTASYFSFFDVSEKIGLVIGTFTFGFLEGITGSMRHSVLAITVFFVLGVILMLFIPKRSFSKGV